MGKCAFIILFLNLGFLASGQSLKDLLDDYNLDITEQWSSFNIQEVADSASVLENSIQYFSPNCDCTLIVKFNQNYRNYYPLPPHADLMTLLATIAGNRHYSLSILKDFEGSKKNPAIWLAEAHFAPSDYFPEYNYGWIRTYYQESLALIHYIILYNGTKKSVADYIINYSSKNHSF